MYYTIGGKHTLSNIDLYLLVWMYYRTENMFNFACFKSVMKR